MGRKKVHLTCRKQLTASDSHDDDRNEVNHFKLPHAADVYSTLSTHLHHTLHSILHSPRSSPSVIQVGGHDFKKRTGLVKNGDKQLLRPINRLNGLMDCTTTEEGRRVVLLMTGLKTSVLRDRVTKTVTWKRRNWEQQEKEARATRERTKSLGNHRKGESKGSKNG